MLGSESASQPGQVVAFLIDENAAQIEFADWFLEIPKRFFPLQFDKSFDIGPTSISVRDRGRFEGLNTYPRYVFESARRRLDLP